MKTIEFHEDGIAIADNKAEDAARDFLKDATQDSIKVSTDNFILAIRCLVYERRFPYDQVIFLFKGKKILLDKYSRIAHWPNGFCDHQELWLSRLLAEYPKEDWSL